MRKIVFVFASTFATIAFAACVSDTTPTGVQGELNGPCFSNNTCNPGLACKLVNSVGKCVADPDASITDSGGEGGGGDSGPRICSFQPTTFPCGPAQMMAKNACFAQAPMCTVTGCMDPSAVVFECFSPNQCSSAACCITKTNANLVPTNNCLQGALQLLSPDAGGGFGASCATAAMCPGETDTQLCQANGQCPSGKVCSPVQITGGPASLTGFIIGACVPQ